MKTTHDQDAQTIDAEALDVPGTMLAWDPTLAQSGPGTITATASLLTVRQMATARLGRRPLRASSHHRGLRMTYLPVLLILLPNGHLASCVRLS